ncbi:unnamed protein product, partial [Cuscuta campestris]
DSFITGATPTITYPGVDSQHSSGTEGRGRIRSEDAEAKILTTGPKCYLCTVDFYSTIDIRASIPDPIN